MDPMGTKPMFQSPPQPVTIPSHCSFHRFDHRLHRVVAIWSRRGGSRRERGGVRVGHRGEDLGKQRNLWKETVIYRKNMEKQQWNKIGFKF